MQVQGKHFRTIWVKENHPDIIQVIDQRPLPHAFVVEDIRNTTEMAVAIKDMHVRGAGLIGAAAGYGMYLAALEAPKGRSFDASLQKSAEKLIATRPTAVNLTWAVQRQLKAIKAVDSTEEKLKIAFQTAQAIADEDAQFCRQIGQHGVSLIEAIHERKKDVVNILTHCNAGWLAFVDYGTATAPIYEAHERGIPVHVWVDETRPRNQGARLTAWELKEHGVPHTVIADNVGGHLMQHAEVDMVIVGTDRTTAAGDVANKIGTYLKALAAKDNHIPFYVALPSSSIDWTIEDGVKDIEIEKRGAEEVKYIQGQLKGKIESVLLTPAASPAVNFAFDVTPRHLISGLITERGLCEASKKGLSKLYPEHY